MKLKSFFRIFISVCSLTFSSKAQDFELPKEVSLETKEDYARYEKDIIAAAKWLEATPIGSQADKRVQVNAFVLKWLAGSPSVTVELDGLAAKIAEKNADLLGVFLASYSRYVLENNYSSDKVKAYTAAVKSVINTYNLGGDVKKNKDLLKAIAKDKEGKLEAWVVENMSK